MIQMVEILNEGKTQKNFYQKNKFDFCFLNSSKTKTTQEKSSLPDTNRFTSPITAFRRKKKTPSHTNDPGKFQSYSILLSFS